MTTPTCSKCDTELVAGAHFCEFCGTAVEADRRPLSVRLQEDLGPGYVVMGELGSGGFAQVFLVREDKTGAHLAVKVMREALMISSTVVRRFQREIRYASELNHPNIVAVQFSRERADLVYYAMQRVRGKTLKKHIEERGQLSVEETASILKQLAEGLAYAHEQGYIHRDIKPSNLMLGDDSRVQILDFGIAKALSKKGSNLSVSGELLGSPEYVSPEQASGSSELNYKTDIYSWGIVGYEMLAGRPPFLGNSIQELLHKHIAETPPALREFRPDVPRHVVSVLAKCLEKNSGSRWANIRAAAGALIA
jgi:serine/threonine-protein kinase